MSVQGTSYSQSSRVPLHDSELDKTNKLILLLNLSTIGLLASVAFAYLNASLKSCTLLGIIAVLHWHFRESVTHRITDMKILNVDLDGGSSSFFLLKRRVRRLGMGI